MIMTVAFTPIYINYLGIEAYGIVGIFALLQSWLFLLDLGITPTISREASRFKAGVHSTQSFCDLVRSLEVVFILVGMIIVVSMFFGGTLLTKHWLQIEVISKYEVERALSLCGFFIALRWITGFYRGALTGMQQQVWINFYGALFSSVRGFGVVAVLAWISPTILAFLVFQIVISIVECILFAVKTHCQLPTPPQKSSFRWNALKQVLKFSVGMSLNMLQVLLLTQVDKLLLSRLLTLADFGYYTLASTLAGGLFVIVGAITNVAYPKFVFFISKDDSTALIKSYHKFSQLVSVLVITPAILIAIFAYDILFLWTHNASTSSEVAPILSLLLIGNLLNCLMQLPYFLQIAYGWTKLNITINFISILVVIPAIYFTIPLYGKMAPPIIWIILNVCFFIFSIPIMHKRILTSEMWRWYWQDNVILALYALSTIGIVYLVIPTSVIDNPLLSVFALVTAAILGLLVSILATPFGRIQLLHLLRAAPCLSSK